jgi:protein-ribulosamine 3-kinase
VPYGGETISSYLLLVELLENIFNDCGLKVQHYEPVYGGDINKAYCLTAATGKYFLKVNDRTRYSCMFEKEERGLELLRRHCSLIIPVVIKTGAIGGWQYLLLEWLDKGSPGKDIWERSGQHLALMHKQPQEYFGLNENNYIGSLEQLNDRRNEWPAFYAECRIIPLIKLLFDEGRYSKGDLATAGVFLSQLKNIFPPEPPALLHGDLWSGNYLIHSSGYASIFDPAVYYGHREMDIGMTRLFGGFDHPFYNAYNEVYPLTKGWEQRLAVAQLYPLLVHAVLFGGHYIGQARDIMQRCS